MLDHTTTRRPDPGAGRTPPAGAGDRLPSGAAPPRQLRAREILLVWAAAAGPMGLLAWVVAPAVADGLDGAAALPRALIVALTAGLVWQFVLVAILVRREQGSLRRPVVRDALWLRAPRSPRTGRRGGRTWLVLVPLVLAFAAEAMIPDLAHDAARDLGELLDSPAGEALFAGSWGWFAVVVTLALFNTVLGEELLFRGYLLPRMAGACGRGDWLANGVLFSAYHVHMPWAMPAILLDALILAYPTRRYRSALVGIAVHSVQSVVILIVVLALVV